MLEGQPPADLASEKAILGANCSVSECQRKVYSLGICSAHYLRWLKFGDTLPDKPLRKAVPRKLPQEDRLWYYVPLSGWNNCWEWMGSYNAAGYGQHSIKGIPHNAHREIYQFMYGPVSQDLHVDHLCRNTKCVNFLHLEAVTVRENTLRGIGPSAKNAKKTHCPKGHPYDEENTYWHRNTRYCRSCGSMSGKSRQGSS